MREAQRRGKSLIDNIAFLEDSTITKSQSGD
jgi:hypothetical protein